MVPQEMPITSLCRTLSIEKDYNFTPKNYLNIIKEKDDKIKELLSIENKCMIIISLDNTLQKEDDKKQLLINELFKEKLKRINSPKRSLVKEEIGNNYSEKLTFDGKILN